MSDEVEAEAALLASEPSEGREAYWAARIALSHRLHMPVDSDVARRMFGGEYVTLSGDEAAALITAFETAIRKGQVALRAALLKTVAGHCEFRGVSGSGSWGCMTHISESPECALHDVFEVLRGGA